MFHPNSIDTNGPIKIWMICSKTTWDLQTRSTQSFNVVWCGDIEGPWFCTAIMKQRTCKKTNNKNKQMMDVMSSVSRETSLFLSCSRLTCGDVIHLVSLKGRKGINIAPGRKRTLSNTLTVSTFPGRAAIRLTVLLQQQKNKNKIKC